MISDKNNTKGKILIVDDERFNRALIKDELLSIGYEVLEAAHGEEALHMITETTPDVILLDLIMPGLDGFEVCSQLKEKKETESIPIIMLTSLTDRESKYRGLKAGANDFLNKPVDIFELSLRLSNVLALKETQDKLRENNEKLEELVELRTGELQQAFIDSIYRLTIAAEYKDKDTANHLRRVSYYSSFLCKASGHSEHESELMFYASPMHDIGKIGIPDSILLDKGRLSKEQFEIMKQHTLIGGKILSGSESDYLKSGGKCALYHHENWDGSGYPHGLKGEEIPIEGRLMLICDRYDAIRSVRPYKKAIGHEETMTIMRGVDDRSRPMHFDPTLFETFLDNNMEFSRIYDNYKEVPLI